MKTIIWCITCIILTFGYYAKAALTATTGVSTTPITIKDAGLGLTQTTLNVSTDPGQEFLSYRIRDTEGALFTLNSVTIDLSINDNLVLTEFFQTYDIGNRWNRFGSYVVNTYMVGSMNQGQITNGFGVLDDTTPYMLSLKPGDIFTSKVTYNTSEGYVYSTGTITYIPEVSTSILTILSATILLRRKRCG